MFGQEKPAVCSPSSRPKSPSSGQKEPDVEEDPLELAFQEVAKYLDILPPQAATALKGRMVESHQRFLKHKELEKEAERIYAILGGNTANGRILGGLLETNKRAEQMMADLAEETRQAWIQLGLTEYNGPTEESNRE